MEYIYGHRQNTTQVSSRLSYFLPVVEEKLDDIEVSALRDYLGRTATTIFSVNRVIVDHEVYHSLKYKRKRNTCSNVVEAEHRGQIIHSSILKFLLLNDTTPVALLKTLHHHCINICSEVTCPTKSFIRQLQRDRAVGTSFITVEELDDVAIVDCCDIKRKCIYIPFNDYGPTIWGLIVPNLGDFQV